MLQTVLIQVTGKVQGVFYRQSTKEFAIKNNITGEVKNLPDSSVQIIATGTAEQLNLLEQWCHRGPARAQVTEVNVTPTELKLFEQFSIIR
jgi:acylphosphatase